MDQDKRTLEFLKLFVRHQQEIYAYLLLLLRRGENDLSNLSVGV
jgi:hypothetical protein